MVTVFALAGLGNRMRVMSTVKEMATKTKAPYQIVWQRDRDLNCRFCELFQPIPGMKVLESPVPLHLQLPSKRNMYLPLLYRKLFVNRIFKATEIKQLFENGFDFKTVMNRKNVFIYTYEGLDYSSGKLDYFIPVKPLQEQIKAEKKAFGKRPIGIHIRRTDHQAAIENSPLQLFIEAIERELIVDDQTTFFLSTDSPETKRDLQQRFGEKILTRNIVSDRNTEAGIKDALVDMFLLAHTQKMYGSYWSTFSEFAARINGIEITYLKK